MSIPVIETYSDYQPRYNAKRIVETLLATVPDKYFQGLGSVVLTNFSAKSRRDRIGTYPRKGRKLQKKHVAGLYHEEWRGQPAWIEIYVDKIHVPPKVAWWPPAVKFFYGEVVFHELGHHAHHQRPEFKDPEDVAERWARKFGANFLRQHYWSVRLVVWILRPLFAVKRFAERRKRN